jgi:putative transposase
MPLNKRALYEKSRYSEEQSFEFCAKQTVRPSLMLPNAMACRRRPFYAWQKRFGEMEANDVRRLKELETENGRLKKLLAERDLAIEGIFAACLD